MLKGHTRSDAKTQRPQMSHTPLKKFLNVPHIFAPHHQPLSAPQRPLQSALVSIRPHFQRSAVLVRCVSARSRSLRLFAVACEALLGPSGDPPTTAHSISLPSRFHCAVQKSTPFTLQPRQRKPINQHASHRNARFVEWVYRIRAADCGHHFDLTSFRARMSCAPSLQGARASPPSPPSTKRGGVLQLLTISASCCVLQSPPQHDVLAVQCRLTTIDAAWKNPVPCATTRVR
jgi:hypothetical protein